MKRNCKRAVILKWNETLPAPILTGRGEGAIANQILLLAKERGIQIVEEEFLPTLLFEEKLNQFIPVELYEVVAKILTTVYNLEVDED